MVDLGTLGGGYSSAVAVNEAGQVVGMSSEAGDATDHAFSWTRSGGMLDLGTLPGGVYSTAAAVNQRGDVAGSSSTGGGELHAVLWTNPARGER
jgi:probable HAF family extracellular repeat protein